MSNRLSQGNICQYILELKYILERVLKWASQSEIVFTQANMAAKFNPFK